MLQVNSCPLHVYSVLHFPFVLIISMAYTKQTRKIRGVSVGMKKSSKGKKIFSNVWPVQKKNIMQKELWRDIMMIIKMR